MQKKITKSKIYSLPTILIVGAGPTGLVLANYLAKQKMPFRIIDKNLEISQYSKALTVNAASLKVFHSLGIAHEIIKQGNKLSDVFLYYQKKRLFHINKLYIDSPYNCYVAIPQPQTELLLESNLEKLGKYVDRNHHLVSIENIKNGLYKAKIRNVNTNKIQEETYRYIVGCDGANSTVRKLTGIDWYGKNYNENFYIIDVNLECSLSLTAFYYFIDDKSLVIILPMQNNLTRLVIWAGKNKNFNTNDPEYLTKYLNHHLPGKYNVKSVCWFSDAFFYSRTASTNQVENIFLAGDSYHLFSPIGGMGMNTGIQDALALGWRLVHAQLISRHKTLLRSYMEERMPQVEKVRDFTDMNTELILGGSSASDELVYLQTIYSPRPKNRKYATGFFPYVFSGLMNKDAFSHSYIKSQHPLLLNQHAPYFTIYSDEQDIQNSYEIPQTGKFCFLMHKSDHSQKFWNILERFHELVFVAHPDNDEKIAYILKNQLLLISPDGLIKVICTINEINKVEDYLNNLYGEI